MLCCCSLIENRLTGGVWRSGLSEACARTHPPRPPTPSLLRSRLVHKSASDIFRKRPPSPLAGQSASDHRPVRTSLPATSPNIVVYPALDSDPTTLLESPAGECPYLYVHSPGFVFENSKISDDTKLVHMYNVQSCVVFLHEFCLVSVTQSLRSHFTPLADQNYFNGKPLHCPSRAHPHDRRSVLRSFR